MRVIITGGAGLIGQALTASLTKDGHEVIVLSRNPAAVKPLPKGAHAEQWDGQSARGWAQWIDSHTAIVNLAGATISKRWTESQKKAIRDSRLSVGRAVVEAVKAASEKPAVVVQSSAVGYYGPRGSEEIGEDAGAGSDFLASVAKDWEASTAEIEQLGVRRVIVRTGVVLSKHGGALPLMALPVKLFAGGPLGGGKQYLPWIHLDDEVAAIRFVIENSTAKGAYNLSAPQPVTNAEFTKVLGKVLGRPTFLPTPGFALKIVLGEMSALVLDGQRQMPKRLLAAGFKFKFSDAASALRDIYQ
jgi:uncharacterized protein (TIGR01777 family)